MKLNWNKVNCSNAILEVEDRLTVAVSVTYLKLNVILEAEDRLTAGIPYLSWSRVHCRLPVCHQTVMLHDHGWAELPSVVWIWLQVVRPLWCRLSVSQQPLGVRQPLHAQLQQCRCWYSDKSAQLTDGERAITNKLRSCFPGAKFVEVSDISGMSLKFWTGKKCERLKF